MPTETDEQTEAEVRWKWRWECAWRARGYLIGVNRGRYPKNLREWRRVARRLNIKVEYVRHGQLSMAARLVGDVIQVRRSDPREMARWVAHEVVEAVLRQDGGLPPVCYPWEPGMDEMHMVAGLVERWDTTDQLAGASTGERPAMRGIESNDSSPHRVR